MFSKWRNFLLFSATSKSRDTIKSELESLKMSFEELTVSSSDVESKLKAANRLQELQTKRVETLEANNERLKASVDSHKVDERKLLTQLESSAKQLKTCRADLEAAQKSAHDWRSKSEDEYRPKIVELRAELQDARRRIDRLSADSKRDAEMRVSEAESRRSEERKWKMIVEAKDREAEQTQARIDLLSKTVKMQTDLRHELNRSVEEARQTRVRMEKELQAVGRRVEAAEEETKRKEEQLDKIRRQVADEAKGQLPLNGALRVK